MRLENKVSGNSSMLFECRVHNLTWRSRKTKNKKRTKIVGENKV